jgi:hydrogenase maturation protease
LTAGAIRVIGVGNAFGSDDAAGLAVARALTGRLRPGVSALEHEGDPSGLLDAWAGAELVVLVDATASGAKPGTVHVLDASERPLPAGLGGTSTHAFGVAQAIELARALGRLPPRVVVVGIEGERFTAGTTPTPAVAAAVEPACEAVLGVLAEHAP